MGLGFGFIQPKWLCREPLADAGTWRNTCAHPQPSASVHCDVMLSHASKAMLCCSLRSALIPGCRSNSSLRLILAVRGGAGEVLTLGELGLEETVLTQ